MTEKTKPSTGKGRKVLTILLSVIAAMWIVLLIGIRIILNESFLTRTVQRIASEYVDGEVGFSGIEASVFRSFPNLNVRIDSFSVICPPGRFAACGSGESGPGSFAGQSPSGDTLASFDRFSLSLNYMSLLAGRIRIRKAGLRSPRIFLHRYDSTCANWDI
ncbi:MAG: hypothetical protein ACI4TJ_05365, partial [Candidatus Cryptobacteroides sp.]